jgi:hypothetical protein
MDDDKYDWRKSRNEEEERGPIEIVDTRHSRDLEAAAPPPEPETPPAGPEIVPDIEPEDLDPKNYPDDLRKEGEAVSAPADDAAAGPLEEDEAQAQEALEMAHIRQVFGAGIVPYLLGQLNFVLNFAVIYLGGAANPATGLVTPDMEKAKLAIDLLEFIFTHVQKELQPADRQNIERVIRDLKLSYMQGLADATVPPAPPPGK